jgi:hypothetical protein
MTETQAQPAAKSDKPEPEPQLSLVLEIIPGQAGEGLIDIFAPGAYEGQSLKDLCQQALRRENWSIEERQIVEDIQRQLKGGIFLCRGREAWGPALEYAVLEETEAGEKFLYVPVRALKPQEGG